MYVRDLRDNHIIYGSPAKDPNWSPAGVANIADREECLNVTADRIIFSGEGAVEIFVYDIDGRQRRHGAFNLRSASGCVYRRGCDREECRHS